MALYSYLPSGGSSTCRRSTKNHTGSTVCAYANSNTIFEFVGGGKVNRVMLEQGGFLGNNSYLAIIVDGVELYRYPDSLANATILHLVRSNKGNIAFTTSDAPTNILPLDIEFKNELKIVAYPTSNTTNMKYEIELATY